MLLECRIVWCRRLPHAPEVSEGAEGVLKPRPGGGDGRYLAAAFGIVSQEGCVKPSSILPGINGACNWTLFTANLGVVNKSHIALVYHLCSGFFIQSLLGAMVRLSLEGIAHLSPLTFNVKSG